MKIISPGFKLTAFLSLTLLALRSQAQSDPAFSTRSPFEDIVVYKAMDRVSNINHDLAKIQTVQPCEKFKANDPNSVVSCNPTDEDIDKSVISKVNVPAGKMDPRLKAALPKEFVKDTEGKALTCIFRFKMQNDNKQMIGCTDKTDKESLAKCGDDAGRTHGLGVALNCVSEDGINRTFDYSTEMYSTVDHGLEGYNFIKDSGDEWRVKQKFISENIFSFVEDNINQGKMTYWKRGVGFINVTDEKKWGMAQSNGQQKWFHGVVNQINDGRAVNYETESGSMNKWGGFVNMAVGLQDNFKLGNRCKVSMSGEAGARLGTIEQANTVNFSSNIKATFRLTENNVAYIRAREEVIGRPTSLVVEQTLAAGLQRRSGSFIEGGVTNQIGNRKDVPDSPNFISDKNDNLVFLRVGYAFGLRR